MKLYVNRDEHFAKLSTLLAAPSMLAEIHADTPVPEPVVQWLGRLKLLHGMPFNYLVPDEAMLPNESIRFFQVDPFWVECLVEGAFSIGRSSSGDRSHDMVFRERLHGGAENAARSLRAAGADDGDADNGDADNGNTAGPITGFFLRSSVVSGWPGLEVTASNAAGRLLPPRRIDRIAPAILLVMVDGVIDHVDISEPPEGLHFGIDLHGGTALRYITVPANAPKEKKPGSPIDGVTTGPVEMRSSGAIKVSRLAKSIGDTLSHNGANNDAGTGTALPFTSAELAMEMVESVRTVRFINKQ